MTSSGRGFRHLATCIVTAMVVAALPAAPVAAAVAIEPPTVTPGAVFDQVVGDPITFALRPGGATIPVRYGYEVDRGRTRTVRATDGAADVVFTPTKRTTILEFWAVAADGTASFRHWTIVHARAAEPMAEQDHDGDDVPDLLAVGGTAGLPSGLWLATGRATSARGRVRTPAGNIGLHGHGYFSRGATEFDGAQIVTGHFTGRGFQDVLAYYPTGTYAGFGVIVTGSGDGSVLQSQYSGNSFSLPVMTLTDANGDDPSQVANAYQMLGEESESDDLIGVTGSAANGYRLAYYPSMFGPGMYDMPIHLTALTPTGGTDWNNWRIATTRLTAGVVMYLWNSSTGALHLWTDLAMTDHGDMTGTLAHTQYEISSSWNPGIPLSTLQITDVNRDGVPDLWTVDTNGVLTTHLVSGLSAHSPATIRTQRPQQLR